MDTTDTKFSLNEDEIEQAAMLLAKLHPGFLPFPIFKQVARLYVSAVIELVPLRRGANGSTEVLLLRRPDVDPDWPNLLHTPGTVLRASDYREGLSHVFDRLYTEEIGAKTSNEPIYLETTLRKSKRGTEYASIYFVDMSEETGLNGEWYPAGQLPPDMLSDQLDFVANAVAKFELSIDKSI